MSNPRVSVSKQVRRLQRRAVEARNRRVHETIARMNYMQLCELACDLWRAERLIATRRKTNAL